MSSDNRRTTEQEPKLSFAKGCLWSLVVMIPVWAIFIWFFFFK
ncbi:hypothetical protein [Paenibacillus marchantiophytorum]|nr:hypothetical protein [Paenibacillus marchantiophytorum]